MHCLIIASSVFNFVKKMKKSVSKPFLDKPERSANQEGAENTQNFVVQLDGKRLLVEELSNLETNKSRKI